VRRALVVVAALAAGCGAPSDAGVDGALVDGACARPALDAPWLTAYVTDVVGALSAAPRATTTQRDAARAYLADQLAALGWSPAEQAFNTGANVYATIPATAGSEPEIIVGAHFDTVAGSPGANDNASGTAVVLALARYLRDTPCRTAPVTVVLFDLEETGLFGSRAFAGTRTPAQVGAVHTIDQVAWDADGDRRFEIEAPTAALADEWRAAAQRAGVTVTTTTTEGTDHQAFRDAGFAAVGLTEEYVGGDTSPYRHTAGDTAATVDVSYLALAARLTADVVLGEVSP
jgi:Zn-dependent M28 family amino/carboxypeptidase